MATSCCDAAVLAGLFLAAYSGNLPEVKSLLKNNALAADVTDPTTGSTALQWASSGGSLEVVEWLVKQAGAKVSHRNKVIRVLHGCRYGHGQDGRSAFFFACEHCHEHVAKFLLGQSAVEVNDKDSWGHSPLHRACIAGQTRNLKAGAAIALISGLLTEAKADASAKANDGRMPGEADLVKEAPESKPSERAAEIREQLETARTGVSPVSTAPAKAPATTPTTPEPKLEPKPAAKPRPKPVSSPSPSPTRSGRPTMTVAAARAAAAASSPSSPRRASPVRVSERAAFLSGKTKPAADVPAAPQDQAVSRAAPAVVDATTPVPASSLPADSGSVSSPVLKPAGSPNKEAAASPPWASKPRPGGVASRIANGQVTAASSVPGASSSAPAPAPAAAPASAAPVKPSVVKQQSYSLKEASKPGSAGPTRLAAGTDSAPEKPSIVKQYSYGRKNVTPNEGLASSSSAPASRFQRAATNAPAATAATPNSATGAAAAVIGASSGLKASALAARFENKARESKESPPAPVRRGNSGLSASALAARAPALASSSSGSSNGSASYARPTAKLSGDASLRAASQESTQPSSPAPRVTPEELLGKGSVMQRKQLYVANAQKSKGSTTSKEAPGPQLAKAKKEGSLMDKFVSMFSISPEASPSTSPTRSSSRSPRSKQRSNTNANGSSKSPLETARLGFFSTNKSFKVEKE